MAESSEVSTGQQATAEQYNDLRKDVLDPTVGHGHGGGAGEGKSLGGEIFIPIQGVMQGTGSYEVLGQFLAYALNAAEYFRMSFKVPSNFLALTHCKVIGIVAGSGTIDWTAETNFAAAGEVYTTHSDSATADGLAVTNLEIEEVDISAALTGIAADDYVGIDFLIDAMDTTTKYSVLGIVFKYT